MGRGGRGSAWPDSRLWGRALAVNCDSGFQAAKGSRQEEPRTNRQASQSAAFTSAVLSPGNAGGFL